LYLGNFLFLKIYYLWENFLAKHLYKWVHKTKSHIPFPLIHSFPANKHNAHCSDRTISLAPSTIQHWSKPSERPPNRTNMTDEDNPKASTVDHHHHHHHPPPPQPLPFPPPQYGTFQGVANYPPPPNPHPAIGFPQPVPPPGAVDSAPLPPYFQGYQAVPGMALPLWFLFYLFFWVWFELGNERCEILFPKWWSVWWVGSVIGTFEMDLALFSSAWIVLQEC